MDFIKKSDVYQSIDPSTSQSSTNKSSNHCKGHVQRITVSTKSEDYINRARTVMRKGTLSTARFTKKIMTIIILLKSSTKTVSSYQTHRHRRYASSWTELCQHFL